MQAGSGLCVVEQLLRAQFRFGKTQAFEARANGVNQANVGGSLSW
jgi:hypothetical protein